MARKKFCTYGLFFVLLICFYVKNIFSQQNLSQKNLNLAVSIPINFNPLLNQNPDMDNILKLIFEPMIKFQNEKPINNLVSQINFEENVANINLRQDIFWSDKTNLTADDVLFSIQQIKSSEPNSTYYMSGENIISVQKISTYSLRIIFANSNFPSIYLLNFPVIPKKFFSDLNQDVKNLISDGAYKINMYKRQKNILLQKNLDYFGDGDENQFETINIFIVPDYKTKIDAFNQSIIDLIQTNSNDLGKFKTDANKIFYPTNQLEFIFFNPNNNLFNIEPIYNAVKNIIPIEQIIKKNNVEISCLSTKIDLMEKEQVKKIVKQSINSNSKIKILVNQENPARIKIANLIQKSFSEYNISSTVEKKSFGDYIQAINKKDFDILIGGFLPKQKLNYEKLFGSENILAYQNDLLINDLNLINQSSDWNIFSNKIKKLNHDIKTSSKIMILGNTKKIILTNKKIDIEKSGVAKLFCD